MTQYEVIAKTISHYKFICNNVSVIDFKLRIVWKKRYRYTSCDVALSCNLFVMPWRFNFKRMQSKISTWLVWALQKHFFWSILVKKIWLTYDNVNNVTVVTSQWSNCSGNITVVIASQSHQSNISHSDIWHISGVISLTVETLTLCSWLVK